MVSGPFAGFGTGPFGTMPFGTSMPLTNPLQIESLLAVRENLVRVIFNIPPRFTQLKDPNDASDPDRFIITPVDGTFGRDDEPTRPVTVIVVEQSEGLDGAGLDLILDRPMSPEPGRYSLNISGLVSAIDETPFPTTTLQYTALFKGLVPLVPEFIINNRDIANPQTRQGIFDPLPVEEGQDLDALLGTFPEDSQGDLAYDEGLAGYKKRVMRRLTTRKGRYSHLPNYGVSMLTSIKQLSRAGLREFLADEAEQQIRQEPETVDVSVVLVVDETNPALSRYRVRARAAFGTMPDFDVPLSFTPQGV